MIPFGFLTLRLSRRWSWYMYNCIDLKFHGNLVCFFLRTGIWAKRKWGLYESEAVGLGGNKHRYGIEKSQERMISYTWVQTFTLTNPLFSYLSGKKKKRFKFRWVFLYYVQRSLISSAYFRLLIFLSAVLIPTWICASSSLAFFMMYSA